MNFKDAIQSDMSDVKCTGEMNANRHRELSAAHYELNGKLELLLKHLNLQHVKEITDGRTKEYYRTNECPFK